MLIDIFASFQTVMSSMWIWDNMQWHSSDSFLYPIEARMINMANSLSSTISSSIPPPQQPVSFSLQGSMWGMRIAASKCLHTTAFELCAVAASFLLLLLPFADDDDDDCDCDDLPMLPPLIFWENALHVQWAPRRWTLPHPPLSLLLFRNERWSSNLSFPMIHK